MTKVHNLICEYCQNPLGIDVKAPRFSWQLGTDRYGARQTAYRIRVSRDANLVSEVLWDSGRIDSDESVLVPYAGETLASRCRAYWNVVVWDEQGNESSSETAWFEMGLLDFSDWSARWIAARLRGGPRTSIPVPQFRKSFRLEKPVAQARLYATALGVYECSLNGRRVGDNVFAPGWTDYSKRVRYQVHDITSLVSQGENALGALLGDGWAAGFLGMGNRQFYVDRAQLLVQLEVTFEDGTTQRIVTDESWTYGFGPILASDMLMGEAYDARLELPGWDTPDFDPHGWLSPETFEHASISLAATNSPMIKAMLELKTHSAVETRREFVTKRDTVDLGQNMVGRVRFRGSAPRGTTVVLRFAEVLGADGQLYTDNLRTAVATDVYTFKGEGEEVWESKFTFHGFRYVEIKDYPGEVTPETITGIVLYSDMPQTGEFKCSDPLLNQLQSNIVWGQRGNFLDVPTDCPQRDERLGWTGDIQVFARTAAFNMNVAGFLTKWAADVRDAQSEAGAVPAVVPLTSFDLGDGGPAWADAAVICPWTIYQCYGDTRVLHDNWDVMTRFMDFVIRESPGHIRCAPDYEGWMGFGDWLSINADTPRDLIGTAFLAYDAKLMAEMAAALEKPDEAARYEKLFTEVRQAFQDRFLVGGTLTQEALVEARARTDVMQADAISQGNLQRTDYGSENSGVYNTELFTPTQTAYVLGLHFDLLPEALRDRAADELVADIERRGMHLSTGFVGAPYLPHVLSKNGKLETAYELLNQKTWPSWLYSVTQGGTTIWERWDGWTEERGFQSDEMNSFNHYAYGSIGAWLYSTVAGINPAKPGYKHVVIIPQPGGGLSYAKASLETPYGMLISHWTAGDGFRLDVTIPPNTSATVCLPVGFKGTLQGETQRTLETDQVELVAGNYQIRQRASLPRG